MWLSDLWLSARVAQLASLRLLGRTRPWPTCALRGWAAPPTRWAAFEHRLAANLHHYAANYVLVICAALCALTVRRWVLGPVLVALVVAWAVAAAWRGRRQAHSVGGDERGASPRVLALLAATSCLALAAVGSLAVTAGASAVALTAVCIHAALQSPAGAWRGLGAGGATGALPPTAAAEAFASSNGGRRAAIDDDSCDVRSAGDALRAVLGCARARWRQAASSPAPAGVPALPARGGGGGGAAACRSPPGVREGSVAAAVAAASAAAAAAAAAGTDIEGPAAGSAAVHGNLGPLRAAHLAPTAPGLPVFFDAPAGPNAGMLITTSPTGASPRLNAAFEAAKAALSGGGGGGVGAIDAGNAARLAALNKRSGRQQQPALDAAALPRPADVHAG